MKMRKKEDISQPGRMIEIYGDTGVGKTVTTLQTSPDPILYIQTEPRSLQPSIAAADREDLDIDIAIYDKWPELMEFVTNLDNFRRHRTVVFDSLSYAMNVGLSNEISDEAFEARSEKDKQLKPLVSQTKLSIEGYGAISANMFRLTAALGRLSQAGKIVVATALLVENPRYNRELAAAPALKGREYPVNCLGYFDLIGLVSTRTDDEGNVVYPPLVRFQSPDGSFLAKFTGKGVRTEGPLDISKIIKNT
jgi:hypothetical protein